MALLFRNDTKNGIRVWVSLVLSGGSACGGGFTTFRKIGWWLVNDGNTINIWNVDLRTVNPVGAFFAEQYAGDYRTWGDLGIPYDTPVRRTGFNQCYDDPTGCDQMSRFALLAFDTAANMQIVLKTKVPEEPNWELFVFD